MVRYVIAQLHVYTGSWENCLSSYHWHTSDPFSDAMAHLPLAEKRPKMHLKICCFFNLKIRYVHVLFFASWRRCTSFSRFIFSAAPWQGGAFKKKST
jgi:hypothetical protein